MNPFLKDDNTEIIPLCYYGHPALKQKCSDITVITDGITKLSERMIKTLRVNEGIGLAGPQIGRNINLVVLDIPIDKKDNGSPSFTSPGEMSLLPMMPLTLINPKLSEFSANKTTYVEGCLSIPGITAEVIRSEFVQLEAKLLSGRNLNYRCGGLLARCLQHECDHLNGILFLELLPAGLRKSLDSQLQELKETLKSHKVN